MSHFYLFNSSIKDSEKFMQYAAQVPDTLTPFGGEIILRGKQQELIAGEVSHPMLGILSFPDENAARDWYHSPAYQSLIPLRDEAAEMSIIRYQTP